MNQNQKETTVKNKPDQKMKNTKPSNVRKPPVIKQTLTSLYRMAKANPLLVYGNDNTKTEDKSGNISLNNVKLPRSVLLPNSTTHSRNVEHSYAKNGQKTELNRSSQFNTLKSTKNAMNINHKRDYLMKSQSTSQITKVSNPAITNRKSVYQPSKSNMLVETRRSLSAEHYDRKKSITKPNIGKAIEKTAITKSLNDVKKASLFAPIISPVVEENSFDFKIPNADKRRSVSAAKYITSTPARKHHALVQAPVISELQKRLQEWLKQHKKSGDNYKHLRCFGVAYSEDENKENIEDPKLWVSTSYEDLKIPNDSNIDENISCYNKNRSVAQAALSDLHKLICEGYSTEQCETWLGMIREKYEDLDEEYQYWECRAAIEQARGNIISAVDCLRSAIVQGAEVKTVDESLELLLQKFSLLNINTGANGKIPASKNNRAKIISDARTVFKSSIIQFAVQERTLKKNKDEGLETPQKKYFVTPVRRSTRKSRSGFVSTPGVQVCMSMQELDKNISENSCFCTNSALADAFRY